MFGVFDLKWPIKIKQMNKRGINKVTNQNKISEKKKKKKKRKEKREKNSKKIDFT
jgi:hypothetical protein